LIIYLFPHTYQQTDDVPAGTYYAAYPPLTCPPLSYSYACKRYSNS